MEMSEPVVNLPFPQVSEYLKVTRDMQRENDTHKAWMDMMGNLKEQITLVSRLESVSERIQAAWDLYKARCKAIDERYSLKQYPNGPVMIPQKTPMINQEVKLQLFALPTLSWLDFYLN